MSGDLDAIRTAAFAAINATSWPNETIRKAATVGVDFALVEVGRHEQRLADLLEVRTLERDQARAELAEERARRTLGGIPPKPDRTWANLALPEPDTAHDETAPPLHRRTIGEPR